MMLGCKSLTNAKFTSYRLTARWIGDGLQYVISFHFQVKKNCTMKLAGISKTQKLLERKGAKALTFIVTINLSDISLQSVNRA